MHGILKVAVLGGTAALLGACASDGRSAGSPAGTAPMVATVWTDPDGCRHWVIDDGAEGYMSPVLNRDGTPDCL